MRKLLLLGIIAYYATSLNAGIANAQSDFAGNFFKAVAEGKTENLICSPISAELSVIAAGLGAAGETLNQIRSVITTTDKDGTNHIVQFLNALKGYKDIELRMATNIFVANGISLKPNFNSVMQTLFQSTVQNIDFRNAVEASKTINDWCAAHTNNRINEIVTPEGINPDAAVVLMNAIYFKGLWANPFFANETELRPFHVNGKTVEQVPTMYRSGKYFYGKLPELRATFVEIPYKTHDFIHSASMYIILPNDVNGYVELQKNLDKITIETLIENADTRDVHLYLPKFTIESTLELTEPLIKLGLTEMFSQNANFNGIAENVNLRISKIIQKAFLEVNEEGTEGGAATEADFEDRIASSGPVNFIVDRPFFSFVATASQVTLFSAVTVDPRN